MDDLEIEAAATLRPIAEVAAALGLPEEAWEPYGRLVAKVGLDHLAGLPSRDSHLVLVTAMSPTPAGEGKTTTVIGLADALQGLGTRAMACLREPSLGPVFGRKGGAAGGGYAQVAPMAQINLQFTGDFSAIDLANNLLAATVDNHLHQGNALGIDPTRIVWRRVLELGDRALREVVVGLGGPVNGMPRQDGFDITVASEVMAVFCLADSLADLQRRLGDVVVAYTHDDRPVTAHDLRAEGAMTALLLGALRPNLVQTLEGTPAFVHGGPFANIAHGTNSIVATCGALRLADVVVTEAGFGADLGAEKFVDIVCRRAGFHPSAAVLVATVRALKYHGGLEVGALDAEDLGAVTAGFVNLRKHIQIVREVYGLPAVVAVNRFPTDTDAEVDLVTRLCAELGVRAVPATHYRDGGLGARELAREVLTLLEDPAERATYAYALDDSLADKARTLARRVYGAADVSFSKPAARTLVRLEADGYGDLPVCIAKTPASFSTDAALRGAPEGHVVEIREVRLRAGAGFVVLVCGDILTMPGLPPHPAAEHITVVDGHITGLS